MPEGNDDFVFDDSYQAIDTPQTLCSTKIPVAGCAKLGALQGQTIMTAFTPRATAPMYQ